MTWELKSRQSPCTYVDLIGIVALRIIEIGDQSALRFPSLPRFLSFLSFAPPLRYELAYREQEVIMCVFINYTILRVIMWRAAAKEIGEQLWKEEKVRESLRGISRSAKNRFANN